MANDQTATVSVSLPKGGERSVYHIKPHDTVDLSRMDMKNTRVDLLGADLVLTNTKTQATVVLAQLALYLFSEEDAPKLIGANGVEMTPESMLSHVGKVWEFTAQDFLGITSLEKANKSDEDGGNGKSSLAAQVEEQTAEAAAAAAQSSSKFAEPAEPAPLGEGGGKKSDTLVDIPLVAKNGDFSTPPKISVDIPEKAAPDDGAGAGNGLTFTFDARLLQTGAVQSVVSPTQNEIRGGGAFETGVFDDRNAAQYSQEIIDVSAGAKSSYVIYSDNPTYFTDTTATRTLELTPYMPDGFQASQIVVSGLPVGYTLVGATLVGSDWVLNNPTLSTNGTVILPVIYPTGSDNSFSLTIKFTATFDASLGTTKPATGEISYTLHRDVEVKNVPTPTDGNYIDGTGKLVWVMAENENGTKILAGDKTVEVHGGKGVDDVTSGIGNDIIYGGKGNDIISSGGGNDFLQGGDGNDTLVGGAGMDTADYTDKTLTVGIDLVNGAATAYVNGVAEDTLDGIENLNGGNGNDTLYGDANANVLDGGAGDDMLQGRGGNDTLIGNGGNDTVTYAYASNGITVALSSGAATVNVAAGDVDTLSGIENIIGTGFADTMTGDTNANVLQGGAGNDTFYYSSGADVIDGGADVDTLYLTAAASGATLNLGSVNGGGYSTLTVGAVTQTVKGIENVTGSAFGDTITGDSGANTLRGEGGNDTINGGGGNDTVYGGTGSDTLTGGGGSDTLRFDDLSSAVTITMSALGNGSSVGGGDTDTFTGFGTIYMTGLDDTFTESTGADVVYGLAGNDTFKMVASDSANDTFDGGTGTNTVDYTNATSAINLNLASGTATGNGTDTLVNIQNVIGTSGNDTIQGSSANNTLDGGGGSNTLSYAYTSTAVVANLNNVVGGYATITIGTDTDKVKNFTTITGGGGADTFTGNGSGQMFNGGAGNDLFYGSSGADTFNGGTNTDTVNYTTLSNGITATLDASGNATVAFSGLVKTDTLTGIENITGSTGDDTITGNASDNLLRGDVGIDILYGLAGNDTLFGDAGDDTIYGGDGNDQITGGDGNDTLYGNDGDDTFFGDPGDDTIDGGLGSNTMDYGASSGTIIIDMRTATGVASGGTIGTDTLANIQIVKGGSGNDTYYSSSGNDTFVGNGGTDTNVGSDGNDTFSTVETGNYSNYAAKITADLSTGVVQKDIGGNGSIDYTDTYTTANINSISTQSFDDTVTGNSFNNNISTNNGNDTIYASKGSDSINGGSGTDTIYYNALGGTINANLTLSILGKSIDSSSDTFSGIEKMYAGTGNDNFFLNASNLASYVTLDGGGGTDSITLNTGVIASNVEAVNFANVFDNMEVLDLRNATLNGGDSFNMTTNDIIGLTSASRTLDVYVTNGFNLALSTSSGYTLASDTTAGNTRTVTYTKPAEGNVTLHVLTYS